MEILRSRRSLAAVAGMKTPNDHAEPTQVERLKKHLYRTPNICTFKKRSYVNPHKRYITIY